MSAWGITYIDKANDSTCMYCDERNHLIGLKDQDAPRKLASIVDVRYEMAKQRRDLELGTHGEGYLIPWEGVIGVREGYYTWDELIKEYRRLHDDEVEAWKGKQDELARSVRQAVFGSLRASGVDFDTVGVGTGKNKDHYDRPTVIIHLTIYGEHHEFSFSRDEIERKGVARFTEMFSLKIKEAFEKGDAAQ